MSTRGEAADEATDEAADVEGDDVPLGVPVDGPETLAEKRLLASLGRQARAVDLARVVRLVELLDSVDAGTLDETGRREAESLAHQVVGSAETFGVRPAGSGPGSRRRAGPSHARPAAGRLHRLTRAGAGWRAQPWSRAAEVVRRSTSRRCRSQAASTPPAAPPRCACQLIPGLPGSTPQSRPP